MWMMTFGDCMSLLVTFFVMLITFTNVEKDNLLEVLGGMKGALGLVPSEAFMQRQMERPDVTRIGGSSDAPQWLSYEELSVIIPDAKMVAKRFGRPKVGAVERHVLVRMVDEGMAFVISADFLFEEGTGKLLEKNNEMLRQIGNYTREFENEIRITQVLSGNLHGTDDNGRSLSLLGIERAITLQEAFCELCDYGAERFGIGVKKPNSKQINSEDTELPPERMEIVIVGRRELKDITPEEIIVKDQWF
ncbi:hypothetical protein BVX97_01565 [bacterium E08(2017)]|nr:hypothetical protein BVX97_01565 [bacterium E08(2017)]